MAWNFGAGQWWRSPDSIIRLALQIDEAWPSRDRTPDGTAASSQHTAQNPNSDHEPAVDPYGIVCAIDIAHSTGPDGADMSQVAEAIRVSEDPRVKYVIHAERMFSSYPKGLRYPPYTWRPYSGSNPHTSHVHVSVWGEARLYDDNAPWSIGLEEEVPQFTDEQVAALLGLLETYPDDKRVVLHELIDAVKQRDSTGLGYRNVIDHVRSDHDIAGLTADEVVIMIAEHSRNPDAHHE